MAEFDLLFQKNEGGHGPFGAHEAPLLIIVINPYTRQGNQGLLQDLWTLPMT